ncbi:MAG: S-layer homology domain-containing protein [Ruminococcaceae bacterium]|nr:S-layer homology domain-containing protein [Oscillospiraceae bacterium]
MKFISKIAVLLLITVFCSFGTYVFAEETAAQAPQEWVDEYVEKFPNSEVAIKLRYPDMPNDWSTDALVKAVQNGLLNGSDGHILPNDPLTRAQLATILVRAFGATVSADLLGFTDISTDAWYYDYMAKSVAMGIFRGDGSGKIRPDDSITRQEAFTVISRAFDITGADASVLAGFPDGSLVADWASDATASLISNGYVNGSDGYINPDNSITRAEFAQIMKNLVGAYITEPGTYTELPEGSIVIRVPGVVLDGITLTGNLYIGEGVGDSITLSNVSSDHRVVIRGGKSAVLTGNYNVVSVVGKGLTVNISGANVKSHSSSEDSVIISSPGAATPGWGNIDNTGEKENNSASNPVLPEDKDGDGWIDGWY